MPNSTGAGGDTPAPSFESTVFALVAAALREGHAEIVRAEGQDGKLHLRVEIGLDGEGVRWSTGSLYFEQRRGFTRAS